tara:strand:+ start:13090 stop:13878 length:789 start_codon:yes stop_codon:yes gene_type:complete
LSDYKENNVYHVNFGTKKVIENETSIKDAFASLLNEIEDAPDLPSSNKKTEKSQNIVGNNNIQASESSKVRQSIKGNGNVQLSGAGSSVVVNNMKPLRTTISAPIGSIGANVALKNRITMLIKQIEEYRQKRMGNKFKHGVIYGELATAFGLKRKDWALIYLWDEHRADEVLQWLGEKLDNTQQGRVNRAKQNEGHQHTRGQLFALEKNYVEQLDWSRDMTKSIMYRVIGKISRADMDNNEFRNWVMYLRSELEKMYGESED